MSYENILLEIEQGVAVITLNRPEVMNALCHELDVEMLDALTKLESDADIRVLIITGGSKVFAAGADVAGMSNADSISAYATSNFGHAVHNTIEALPFPVIAAINGAAMGGGCELTLACDFRIAGEGALFALPEVGLGILPGGGGTQRLLPLVGLSLAREMVMLGRRVNGTEAAQAGLANICVKDEDVMKTARDWAEKLKKKPAVALRFAKQSINAGMLRTLSDGLELEKLLFSLTFASYDQKEGMAAFLEKRKPQFTNN